MLDRFDYVASLSNILVTLERQISYDAISSNISCCFFYQISHVASLLDQISDVTELCLSHTRSVVRVPSASASTALPIHNILPTPDLFFVPIHNIFYPRQMFFIYYLYPLSMFILDYLYLCYILVQQAAEKIFH